MSEDNQSSTTAAPAPSNFAEFEAGGGTFNPSAAAEPVEKTAAAAAAEPSSEAQAESGAEPETADKQIQDKQPGKKPASAGKPKLSLSDEREKLLREVTELRAQRRELQQQPGSSSSPVPQTGAKAEAKPEEKPLVRPKLSTFEGTLEQYETAVDKYEADMRKWSDEQYEKREQERTAKAENEKRASAYGEKLAEHLKQHPEYDDEIAQTPMSDLMVNIVFHYGPALGQQLIEDKAEARRIQALPPEMQIFEMGRLSAAANGKHPESATETEEAEEEAPASKPVKVPAKLGATGGTPSAINKPDHGANSFAQWEAIEKRLSKRK